MGRSVARYLSQLDTADLQSYLDGYTAFRTHSGFTPAEQEVVFLTISRENGCDYCMAAHSMIAEKVSKVPADVLRALRSGSSITDLRLAVLSAFTSRMFTTRVCMDPECLAQERTAARITTAPLATMRS